MSKHWVRFLPEVGTTESYADKIEEAQLRIRHLLDEVRQTQECIKRLEDEVAAQVVGGWTKQEVAKARRQADDEALEERTKAALIRQFGLSK